MPSALRLNLPLKQTLRYGENPHQAAALYTDGSGTGIANASSCRARSFRSTTLSTWTPAGSWRASSTNLPSPSSSTPTHAAPRPAHTVLEAYNRALAADPLSAFGGVIGINREVDAAAAEEIAKLFVEAIVAPDFTPEARRAIRGKEEPAATAAGKGSSGARAEADLRRHAGAGCGHRHLG